MAYRDYNNLKLGYFLTLIINDIEANVNFPFSQCKYRIDDSKGVYIEKNWLVIYTGSPSLDDVAFSYLSYLLIVYKLKK